MPQRSWMPDPNSGGKKIPELVRTLTEKRLLDYANAHFAGRFTRLDIRFRSQFCYIDAFTEPAVNDSWPVSTERETREEFIARMRNTPTHLCRLRYFGGDTNWGFAFYKYSDEKYELSMFPSGSFFGTPEDAFAVAAGVYLE